VPDPIFEHPRLVAIYDALDPDRSDLDVYAAIASDWQVTAERLLYHSEQQQSVAWAAQALHGTLCATDRRSGCRPVLVTWLGQSNSRARMPAVNAFHSIGLKVSAGTVGSQSLAAGPST